jgi:hypothetical protein
MRRQYQAGRANEGVKCALRTQVGYRVRSPEANLASYHPRVREDGRLVG